MKIYISIILTILFVTFLALYWGTQPLAWPSGNTPVLPGPPRQDYGEIEKRMQFHGTLAAEMDSSGQWWFYNSGGSKCKLK